MMVVMGQKQKIKCMKVSYVNEKSVSQKVHKEKKYKVIVMEISDKTIKEEHREGYEAAQVT